MKYYQLNYTDGTKRGVEGYTLFLYGIEFFLHKSIEDSKWWKISEKTTGKSVFNQRFKTKKYAKEMLISFIELRGIHTIREKLKEEGREEWPKK